MKIATIIARTLLGLIFVVFGLNAFFNFIPLPPPKGELAGEFMKALFVSHYLYAVKCFEISGGLLLLSGSLMDTPPDAGIMLTGAVCITMHPVGEGTKILGSASGAPNTTVGGASGSNSPAPSSAPAAPATPATSPTTSWAMWLFDLLFKK